jgi:hypothetical protein
MTSFKSYSNQNLNKLKSFESKEIGSKHPHSKHPIVKYFGNKFDPSQELNAKGWEKLVVEGGSSSFTYGDSIRFKLQQTSLGAMAGPMLIVYKVTYTGDTTIRNNTTANLIKNIYIESENDSIIKTSGISYFYHKQLHKCHNRNKIIDLELNGTTETPSASTVYHMMYLDIFKYIPVNVLNSKMIFINIDTQNPNSTAGSVTGGYLDIYHRSISLKENPVQELPFTWEENEHHYLELQTTVTNSEDTENVISLENVRKSADLKKIVLLICTDNYGTLEDIEKIYNIRLIYDDNDYYHCANGKVNKLMASNLGESTNNEIPYLNTTYKYYYAIIIDDRDLKLMREARHAKGYPVDKSTTIQVGFTSTESTTPYYVKTLLYYNTHNHIDISGKLDIKYLV